jgi:hypothetical protein
LQIHQKNARMRLYINLKSKAIFVAFLQIHKKNPRGRTRTQTHTEGTQKVSVHVMIIVRDLLITLYIYLTMENTDLKVF